ncbi:MAG: MCE family protein [Candidatus Omnitrophica bacterium]|nr:MCE family protein [Candidatus Omnitrophota bacterium]MCB9747273.1 MCE family protein [Candidatus Omnitrophota bacterium]
MTEKQKNFQIGVFILSGIFLLVAGIVALGVGDFFKRKITMETYFDETVQGLDIGSFVKYRGVKIGEVTDITIVGDYYPFDPLSERFRKYGRYVLVKMEMEPNTFGALKKIHNVENFIQRMVNEHGLRIRLNYLGITGLCYLEIDYVDPKTTPALEIDWKPKNLYVPSVPSTLVRIEQAITNFSQRFEKSFFPILEKINSASSEVAPLLTNLKEGSYKLPELSTNLNETLYHLNEVLVKEKNNIGEVLNNLRLLTNDLKDVTEELRQNPSRFIFGNAPPKTGVQR